MRLHETANPLGERKRECSYRRRSTAATFIGKVAYLVPRRMPKSGLQTLPFEAGAAQFERRGLFGFADDAMQAAFDQRFERHALTRRQFASFAQQRIGNFYGCFHRL